MSDSRITGIVHTKNESEYIAQAVRSLLRFADEVLVADMESTDDTVEIALSLGARVIRVPDFGFVEPARARAVQAASFDWIFILDADEVVPPTLGRKIVEIAAEDAVDVVLIPRVNYMFGRAIRHTGWGPGSDQHAQFFRRGSVQFSELIHASVGVSDTAVVLTLPIMDEFSIYHFNYSDWSDFVARMNRYTSVEADQRSNGSRPSFVRTGLVCVLEFVRRYFLKSGYRDGYEGLVLSSLMVTYRLLTYAKSRQLAERGSDADIRRAYRALARSIEGEDAASE